VPLREVMLAVAGLPDGTTALFMPNPAASASTLTIETTSSTPPGLYELTISGTDGDTTRAATVQLVVHCCSPS